MNNIEKTIKDLAEAQRAVLENEELNQKMQVEKRRVADEEAKTNTEKVDCLRRLLESFTVDGDKTLLGSEPMLKNTLNESDVYRVKNKLFELIDKF